MGARLTGGAVYLLTGCGQGFGVVGLAYVGSICSSFNTGVNQLHNSMSWITFAHELGHNYGGSHSFEEGQGRTGGIMDYGDGKLNGEYQFNTKYRKNEMCQTMNESLDRCSGNFDGECVDTPGWTNSGGHGCAAYEKDWCRSGSFRGVGAFHNRPDRNCCACGKGRFRDTMLDGAITAAPARLIPLLAFGLLLSPLY